MLIFVGLVLAFAGMCVYAQDKPITTTPSQEKFKDDDGLVERATNAGTKRPIDVTGDEIARLYNYDGSLWYEFSYNKRNVWVGESNDELKPFVNDKVGAGFLIFRIKASSKNWYEATVNEETGLTKYIYKFDEALGRGAFEKCIKQSISVKIDKEKNPLRESANGEVIKDFQPDELDKYVVQKIEGDWLQVKLTISKVTGWVRWKENRKILVGYILNDYEVPK
jgi:hypothetical protein